MRSLGRIFDYILAVLAGLVCVIIAYDMVSVDIEIMSRFFLDRPHLWVVEVCEYSLLIITFLGATWVLKQDKHVRMDIVLVRLNDKAQNILNAATCIMGAIICLIITWYGANITWENFIKGTTFLKAVGFPKAPIMSVIPIGCFLLSLQFIRMSYGHIKRLGELRKG